MRNTCHPLNPPARLSSALLGPRFCLFQSRGVSSVQVERDRPTPAASTALSSAWSGTRCYHQLFLCSETCHPSRDLGCGPQEAFLHLAAESRARAAAETARGLFMHSCNTRAPRRARWAVGKQVCTAELQSPCAREGGHETAGSRPQLHVSGNHLGSSGSNTSSAAWVSSSAWTSAVARAVLWNQVAGGLS